MSKKDTFFDLNNIYRLLVLHAALQNVYSLLYIPYTSVPISIFLKAFLAMNPNKFRSDRFPGHNKAKNATLFCLGCDHFTIFVVLSPCRYLASLMLRIKTNGDENIHVVLLKSLSSTIELGILNARFENCYPVTGIINSPYRFSSCFCPVRAEHTNIQ